MVVIQRFPIQILITRISASHRCACQYVLYSLAKPLLLILGGAQRRLDRVHDNFNTLAVCILIPLRRTDLESFTSQMISGKISGARS